MEHSDTMTTSNPTNLKTITPSSSVHGDSIEKDAINSYISENNKVETQNNFESTRSESSDGTSEFVSSSPKAVMSSNKPPITVKCIAKKFKLPHNYIRHINSIDEAIVRDSTMCRR